MKRYIVDLSEPEREELRRLTTSGRAAALKVMHAHVLLKADEGLVDQEIASHLNIGVTTVERIRQRCVMEGLEAALVPKKQPPRPQSIKLDGAGEAQLVHLACSAPPDGRTRWTLKLLADKLVELEIVDGISYEAVRQRLKKKRVEAVANSKVLHSEGKERGVRARHGRCT